MARPRGTVKREPTKTTVPKNIMIIDEDQQAEASSSSRTRVSGATLNAADGGEGNENGTSKYGPILIGVVI